jgi:hypothetical protein
MVEIPPAENFDDLRRADVQSVCHSSGILEAIDNQSKHLSTKTICWTVNLWHFLVISLEFDRSGASFDAQPPWKAEMS